MKNFAQIPWLVLACAVFVFVFSGLFSYLVLDHIPHINDEISYLFQAKIFMLGKFYVPSPCAKEFFNFTHIINNGKWYSQYPPGYPILLLFGLLIGAPWIINPSLASLAIILFYFLGKEIYNVKVGVWTSFLGTISIWYLVMSSTMMSHLSCTFFITLFLLYVFKSLKKPSIMNGFFSGLGLGMAFLIRPQAAIFIGLPFVLFYAIKMLSKLHIMWKNALTIFSIILVFILFFGIFNQITNGHPLKMGYEISHGKEHGFGFGKTGYTDIKHNPFLGFYQIGKYMEELNSHLFGWPLSSFFLFIPLILTFNIKNKHSQYDLLLFSGFLALLIPLFFYWGTYVLIGARMVFESIPIFLLLSARGLEKTTFLISNNKNKILGNKIIIGVFAVFILHAFFIHLPNWANPPDTQWYYHGFSNNYALVNAEFHRTIKKLCPKNSLLIQKYIYNPIEWFPYGWLGSGFLNNAPLLKNEIIYTDYIKIKTNDLFECYPERNVFIFYGTLEKGMIVPVYQEDNIIKLKSPIKPENINDNKFEIINSPVEFFTLYSENFKKFINELFSKENYINIDVPYLSEKGEQNITQENYKKASYFFEAALQIEKNPNIRFMLLNKLSQCYLKTGDINSVKIISKFLKKYEETKLYNIIPERGF